LPCKASLPILLPLHHLAPTRYNVDTPFLHPPICQHHFRDASFWLITHRPHSREDLNCQCSSTCPLSTTRGSLPVQHHERLPPQEVPRPIVKHRSAFTSNGYTKTGHKPLEHEVETFSKGMERPEKEHPCLAKVPLARAHLAIIPITSILHQAIRKDRWAARRNQRAVTNHMIGRKTKMRRSLDRPRIPTNNHDTAAMNDVRCTNPTRNLCQDNW
jgi:hypothetical protein